jgi:hypothetical protein
MPGRAIECGFNGRGGGCFGDEPNLNGGGAIKCERDGRAYGATGCGNSGSTRTRRFKCFAFECFDCGVIA